MTMKKYLAMFLVFVSFAPAAFAGGTRVSKLQRESVELPGNETLIVEHVRIETLYGDELSDDATSTTRYQVIVQILKNDKEVNKYVYSSAKPLSFHMAEDNRSVLINEIILGRHRTEQVITLSLDLDKKNLFAIGYVTGSLRAAMLLDVGADSTWAVGRRTDNN